MIMLCNENCMTTCVITFVCVNVLSLITTVSANTNTAGGSAIALPVHSYRQANCVDIVLMQYCFFFFQSFQTYIFYLLDQR